MPDRNQAALDFLLSRRSRPAKTLIGPYPDRAALQPILTAGLRTPDHGKLEPWRLLVLEKSALSRLAALVKVRGQALGLEEEQIEKGVAQFRDSGCAICVVESPIQSPKVPLIEQTYSAGAVCLALLNAGLASGWGANWLSGWPVYDPVVLQDGLGLGTHERVAGVIHFGTEKTAPPERPRPTIDAKVEWVTQ